MVVFRMHHCKSIEWCIRTIGKTESLLVDKYIYCNCIWVIRIFRRFFMDQLFLRFYHFSLNYTKLEEKVSLYFYLAVCDIFIVYTYTVPGVTWSNVRFPLDEVIFCVNVLLHHHIIDTTHSKPGLDLLLMQSTIVILH